MCNPAPLTAGARACRPNADAQSVDCLQQERLLLMDTTDQVVQSCRDEVALARERGMDTLLSCLLALANAIDMRYRETWQISDLDEIIRLCRTALSTAGTSIDNSDALLVRASVMLCNALEDWYKHTGDTDYVQEQVSIAQHTHSLCHGPHPLLPAIFRALGSGLRSRFECFGQAQDLEDAARAHRQAVAACAGNADACARCLGELGWTARCRYMNMGQSDDLTSALQNLDKALRMGLNTSNSRHELLNRRGSVLLSKHRKDDDAQDLQRCICSHAEALWLQGPLHRDRHESLLGLASVIIFKFDHYNDRDLLDDSERLLREALVLLPNDHPARLPILVALSHVLTTRFEELGNEGHLHESISLLQSCLDCCPSDHRRRDAAMSTLAFTYLLLHHSRGTTSYLETSIQYFRDALKYRPPTHPTRDMPLINLGHALILRYERVGSLPALLEATELFREAMQLRPKGHPNRVTAAVNLAEARQIQRKAFIASSHEGDALLCSTQHVSNLADIDRTIVGCKRALNSRPPGHFERHNSLNGLAGYFAARYRLSGLDTDASEAMNLQLEACGLLAEGHPDQPIVAAGLAQMYILERTPYYDCSKALNLLRRLLHNSAHYPDVRLAGALKVLQTLEQLPERLVPTALHPDIVEVYRRALSLLPQVAYLGLDVRSRLQVLAKAQNIASIAAARALLLESPGVALEILEEGRTGFWSQHRRLQRPVEGLPEDIEQRLQSVTRELKHMPALQGRADGETPSATNSTLEASAEETRRLLSKFDSLVAEARGRPGLSQFMMPKSYSELAYAASRGPVAVFLAGRSGCFALLIASQDSEPATIRLQQLEVEDLHHLDFAVRSDNLRGRAAIKAQRGMHTDKANEHTASPILLMLWCRVMEPVVTALRLRKAKGRARPRLFICSTGAFSNLPLHAAGRYTTRARQGCADYCVVSYTPTLSSLIDARRTYRPLRKMDVTVLLATVPRPFKHNAIYDVIQEARVVSQVINQHISREQLTALPDATATSVLERAPKANILHLACHGEQNAKNALASGFYMRDEMLTIGQLLGMEHPSAFLAVLSACETAKNDVRQPDEAMSLAAAMFFAGFKSVVGTMWVMSDTDGPLIASTLYHELLAREEEFIDPDAVPYALDAAVTKLRGYGLRPNRWAPYVHFGI